MSKNKKIIVIHSADQKKADLVATQIGSHLAHLRKKNLHSIVHMATKMQTVLRDTTCKQFGLMHSYDAYAANGPEWMNAEQQEFFGWVPNQLFKDTQEWVQGRYGASFLGRTMARRIRFDTLNTLFVLSDCPNVASLLALALEVDASNVMLLNVDTALDIETHEMYALKEMSIRNIPTADINLMRILVKACVREFLGILEE